MTVYEAVWLLRQRQEEAIYRDRALRSGMTRRRLRRGAR